MKTLASNVEINIIIDGEELNLIPTEESSEADGSEHIIKAVAEDPRSNAFFEIEIKKTGSEVNTICKSDKHIEMMQETFKKIGIEFVVREDGDYSYLFIGEARCMAGLDDNFKTTNIDHLALRHKYYEFEKGELVAYSNS